MNDTRIPKFRRAVIQNFPFIEEDFDALTDYGLICKIVEYLNKVIDKANYFDQQYEELNAAFVQLKSYVDNYFANLDVQEEINTKLEDMADSGQLQEIIAAYLQLSAVLAFDTKSALKEAQNIIDGSIAMTLGQNTYDDGKITYYKIREKQESDVIDDDKILALEVSDELIAEKIDDIKFKQLGDLIEELRDDTLDAPANLCKVECKWSYSISSYFTMIKLPKNIFNFTIIPYATYGYDGAYKYVDNHPKSITINGQLSSPTIIDGVVTVENPDPSDEYWYIFGLDSDGNPKYTKDIHRTLNGTNLLALGYKQAFGIWSPIVINGTNFNPSAELDTTDSNYAYIIEQSQPRSILGYDDDYWYLIIVEGRLPRSKGTTLAGAQTLMSELNIPNAFNMDGGSNTQLWISNPTTNLGIRDNSRYPRGYTSNNTYSLIKFTEIGE